MKFLLVIFSVIIVLSIGVCIDGGMPKEKFLKTIFKRFIYAFICWSIFIFSVVLQICGVIFLLKLIF